MKSKIALAVGAVTLMAAVLTLSFSTCTSQQSNGKGTTVDVKRGEYLVNFGGCHDCHSPKVMTAQGPMPDTSRMLSGHPAEDVLPPLPHEIIGMEPGKWATVTNQHLSAWYGPWGVSFAINLTPDKATGTGSWTEGAFIKAMRTGKHLGAGRAILPPMPWFNLATLTDDDLKSIFAYLKSLPAIQNEVPMPIPPEGQPSGTPAGGN
jgi:mono/diheme cytochrome c family protein